MAVNKIKRSQIATLVNVTPNSSTASYKLLGVGVTTGSEEMNPKTTEETYIHEDTASISIDSYRNKFIVVYSIIRWHRQFYCANTIYNFGRQYIILGKPNCYIQWFRM